MVVKFTHTPYRALVYAIPMQPVVAVVMSIMVAVAAVVMFHLIKVLISNTTQVTITAAHPIHTVAVYIAIHYRVKV